MILNDIALLTLATYKYLVRGIVPSIQMANVLRNVKSIEYKAESGTFDIHLRRSTTAEHLQSGLGDSLFLKTRRHHEYLVDGWRHRTNFVDEFLHLQELHSIDPKIFLRPVAIVSNDDGVLGLVLERFQERQLKDVLLHAVLHPHGFEPGTLLDAATRVSKALEEIHARGSIHADFKGEHVMFDGGKVTIYDPGGFHKGYAQMHGAPEAELREGFLFYMNDERIMAKQLR